MVKHGDNTTFTLPLEYCGIGKVSALIVILSTSQQDKCPCGKGRYRSPNDCTFDHRAEGGSPTKENITQVVLLLLLLFFSASILLPCVSLFQ
jgi:hypothetical protein